MRAAAPQRPPAVDQWLKDAQTQLDLQPPTSDSAAYLRAAMVGTLLDYTNDQTVAGYAWRNSTIAGHVVAGRPDWQTIIPDDVWEIIRNSPPFAGLPTTEYINDCRAQGVPIPPEWDESGAFWQYQGELTINLLMRPEVQYAGVWTWNDPSVRGACVALPRGTGGPDSLAGIICQSATTGHACFWDNQLRSDPARTFGWSGQTLVITDLVDGTNQTASQPCVNCHTGNNVFIMSPNDESWLKIMEGRLEGGTLPTWTVRVESSTDVRGGLARYIPIPGPTERPEWSAGNTYRGPGCSGACHEFPSEFVMGKWRADLVPMPPPCATPNLAACYLP